MYRRRRRGKEFKEAKSQYDYQKLQEYWVGLANEGGGVLLLGITNVGIRRRCDTRSQTEPRCPTNHCRRTGASFGRSNFHPGVVDSPASAAIIVSYTSRSACRHVT
jgi:hypothetical protein